MRGLGLGLVRDGGLLRWGRRRAGTHLDCDHGQVRHLGLAAEAPPAVVGLVAAGSGGSVPHVNKDDCVGSCVVQCLVLHFPRALVRVALEEHHVVREVHALGEEEGCERAGRGRGGVGPTPYLWDRRTGVGAGHAADGLVQGRLNDDSGMAEVLEADDGHLQLREQQREDDPHLPVPRAN